MDFEFDMCYALLKMDKLVKLKNSHVKLEDSIIDDSIL